jgi:hypothetical protein
LSGDFENKHACTSLPNGTLGETTADHHLSLLEGQRDASDGRRREAQWQVLQVADEAVSRNRRLIR